MVCHDLDSNPHNDFQNPAGPDVVSGTAGSTEGTAEVFTESSAINPHYYTPTLPGLENYFPPPPLELDNSSETLTEKLNRILDSSSRNDFSSLSWDQKRYLLDWEEENGQGVGACLNIYPSGEITGGCYSLGRKSAPGRRGEVSSNQFTRQARKTIRRAVESRVTNFKLFITLTFDPKLAQLDESGRVDQKWAKKEFTQFLNTAKKRYDRMSDKTGKDHWRLSYIWVAEIQEENTKNIHFHILVDRSFIDVKWLVSIWGQASNSVNVTKLNNQEHAANYMLKYMGKGSSPIEGRRYGMTQNLIEGSKPVKINLYGRAKRRAFLSIKDDLGWEIEQNGGKVMDWGIYLPPPRRERQWKDKQGITRTARGTSQRIGLKLQEEITAAMANIEAVDEILTRDDDSPEDLPF